MVIKRNAKKHGVWKPARSPYFYCSFEIMGVRFNGSTNMTNEQDAIAFCKRWKASERKKLEKQGSKVGRNMTFLAAVNRFVKEYVKKNGKAPYRETDLDWIVDKIGPNTKLSSFDAEMLNDAIEARGEMFRWGSEKHGLVRRGTIVASVLRPISAIVHKARDEWGVPIVNMPKMSQLWVPYARKRELSMREEIALLPHCGDYRDLIEFCLLTGLRRESALLKRNEVFLEEGCIRVTVKGGGIQEITLTPSAKAIIKANIDNPTDAVFTYKRRTKEGIERAPITGSGFYYAFKVAAARAGIEDLVIHDLRRTAGARMYRATGDIGTVSKFLGHANVLITQKHYVHISRNDVLIATLAKERAEEILRAAAVANLSGESKEGDDIHDAANPAVMEIV